MFAPSVSIIIPAFNAESYLEETINAALSQTNIEIEIIVVDDGSTDRTSEIAAKFGGRIQLIRQSNSGLPAAPRNTGLRQARGLYVLFLDSDDLLEPNAVEKLFAKASSGTSGVAYGGWAAFEDKTNRVYWTKHADTLIPDPFHSLLTQNISPPMCFLFPRNVAIQVGGFDEAQSLRGHEDWDFLLRIASTGIDFRPVASLVARYRIVDGSVSKNIPAMVSSGHVALSKQCRAHANCEECRRGLSRGRNFLRVVFWKEFFLPTAFNRGNLIRGPAIAIRETARHARRDPFLLVTLGAQFIKEACRRVKRRLKIKPE